MSRGPHGPTSNPWTLDPTDEHTETDWGCGRLTHWRRCRPLTWRPDCSKMLRPGNSTKEQPVGIFLDVRRRC